jgi:hypothetical protein
MYPVQTTIIKIYRHKPSKNTEQSFGGRVRKVLRGWGRGDGGRTSGRR